MNPISKFGYSNVNYYVEHHMYPMVPYHALRALHDEIKADLPAASPSIASAFREFVPVRIQQRNDDNVFIRRQLPSIAPHGATS